MKRILITGARGFLGRNLAAHLLARGDCKLLLCDLETSEEELRAWLCEAEVIFHLAGVNRPLDPAEFESGNAGFTAQICELLREAGRTPRIVFASSIQAVLENPYGLSKRKAEQTLRGFAASTGAEVRVFRLKNLFGKWCRPNYNSVVATFCHNIANNLPISISDSANEVELSYVDDVVAAFLADGTIPSYRIALGDLAGRIEGFRGVHVPDFAEWFNRALYATYLSYLPAEARRHNLEIRADARGSLAEFIKSEHCGQIFVSRTKPGVTRGNHYHHTKTEKFFVVAGEGLIRMRQIEGGEAIEYRVRGEDFSVVDIPPGYTHSIENRGEGELVTLFWASEVFDPARPDTYAMGV